MIVVALGSASQIKLRSGDGTTLPSRIMGNKLPILTHAPDQEIYVPAAVDISDLSSLGDLKDRYLAVREAISRTHGSVRDMWGTIFEFSIACLKKENSDTFKRLCELHDVTARKSSSQFNRAVKIAIGTPIWDDDNDRMVFNADDNQVTRYCKLIDLASQEFGIINKNGFVAWLGDESSNGGGGTISEALVRATDWANRNKFPAWPTKDDFTFNSRLERLRTESRVMSKALFANKSKLGQHGFEEGKHYTLTISIVDGRPVLDAVDDCDEEDFRKALKSFLPQLTEEETPLLLSQFLDKIRRDFADFEAVDVTIDEDHATVVPTSDDDGDSSLSKTYFLGPQIKNAAFSVSKSALKEIGLCTKVFSEKYCRWQLRKTGISVVLPEGLTAQKVEEIFNARRVKKIALDDLIVRYVEGGTRVSISFRPKQKTEKQVEFSAP